MLNLKLTLLKRFDIRLYYLKEPFFVKRVGILIEKFLKNQILRTTIL